LAVNSNACRVRYPVAKSCRADFSKHGVAPPIQQKNTAVTGDSRKYSCQTGPRSSQFNVHFQILLASSFAHGEHVT